MIQNVICIKDLFRMTTAMTGVCATPVRTVTAKVPIALPRRAGCKPQQRLAAQPDNRSSEQSSSLHADATKLALLAVAMSPALLDASPAEAVNNLVAGKTVSLIHPLTMIFLFGSSVYTGWLGLQWR